MNDDFLISVQRKNGKVTHIETLPWSNWHAHARQDEVMEAVVPEILRGTKYVLLMPNLNPPLTTFSAAEVYHRLINAVAHKSGNILSQVVTTVYLSGELTTKDIEKMARSSVVRAVKYYPPHKGATTGSGHGIPLEAAHDLLRAMEANGVPLLGHFESPEDKDGRELPHREREGYFVRNHLPWLRETYPDLLISCEHGTTKAMVDFVKQDESGKTVMTVTPQGMTFAEVDGLFPDYSWQNHLKCMPIVKTPEDRDAVREFATSGDERVFAGDDAAPHLSTAKSKLFADAASGCWTPHALALYARAFENAGCLDERFVQFTALNGPAWWGLPPPKAHERIRPVADSEHDIPEPLEVPGRGDRIIPLGWSTSPDAYHPGFRMAY